MFGREKIGEQKQYCEKCGKEERALLMFEDYGMGYECLSCGHSERVDRVDWIDGDKLPADWGLG